MCIHFDKYSIILTYFPLMVLFPCYDDVSLCLTNTNCYTCSWCKKLSSLKTSMDKKCTVTVLKYKLLVGDGKKKSEACQALFKFRPDPKLNTADISRLFIQYFVYPVTSNLHLKRAIFQKVYCNLQLKPWHNSVHVANRMTSQIFERRITAPDFIGDIDQI